jgi:hypothetical protein
MTRPEGNCYRFTRYRTRLRRCAETLTVHKLRVPDQLRRTLCCTNVIESAFSTVETVCPNVKRRRPGDQIECWVDSGLLVAERQFRKAIGHRQIPLLLSSMANAVSKKSDCERSRSRVAMRVESR